MASGHSFSTAAVDELAELHTYFPRAADDRVFCLSCGSHGHCAVACPLQTCELCGAHSDTHTKFGCPSRCRWCCTPGHDETACKSKEEQTRLLAEKAPPRKRGDADPPPPVPATCLFCRADTGHVGDVCPTIWRTIAPDPTQPRSAKRLCMACYVCGAGNHFGGDCPENTGRHVSGRLYSRQDDIWSRTYCLQFTDFLEPTVHTNAATTTGPYVVESARPSLLQQMMAEVPQSKQAQTTAAGNHQKKSQTTKKAYNQAKENIPIGGTQPRQQKKKKEKPKQQLQTALPTRTAPDNTKPAGQPGKAAKTTAAVTAKQPENAAQPQKAQPTARTRRAQRRRANSRARSNGDATADAGNGYGDKQKKQNARNPQKRRAVQLPGQNGQNGQNGESGPN